MFLEFLREIFNLKVDIWQGQEPSYKLLVERGDTLISTDVFEQIKASAMSTLFICTISVRDDKFQHQARSFHCVHFHGSKTLASAGAARSSYLPGLDSLGHGMMSGNRRYWERPTWQAWLIRQIVWLYSNSGKVLQ